MALEQPKRPKNAYMLYLEENRAAFRKEAESKGVTGKALTGAVAKIAGEKWKALSAKEKKVYEDKGQSLRQGFEEQKKAFTDSGGVVTKKRKGAAEDGKKGKKAKAPKDPNLPPRPVGGAYGTWFAAVRDELKKELPEGSKIQDVAKAGPAKWAAMSKEEKAPWEAKYAEKKKAYEAAVAAAKAGGSAASAPAQAEEEGDGEEEGDEEEGEEEE